MNKRVIAALLLGALLANPSPASAHVFLRDDVAGLGAILHVTPDDDPVAGETASLFFDIQGNHIQQASHQATLTITNDQQRTTTVPVHMTGNTIAAQYIFEQQGTYVIQLEIGHTNKPGHRFTYNLRVSRGVFGNSATQQAPFWAEAGIIITALGALTAGVILWNRRKTIGAYSK